MYTGVKPNSSGARILVVRLGAMGDLIHTLPAVASLKHGYPGSHLSWAVEPRWGCLLEGNPFVDQLIVLERGRPAGLVASWRKLRAQRFDFAVDFQGLIKSAMVACVARPDRIFGFHRSQLREKLAGVVYSSETLSHATHVVDRNLDLAVAAGAASVVRCFHLPSGAPEGALPEQPFVLASPFAGWRSKQWPLEYYGELARRLKQDLGAPLVLNAPPGPHLEGIPGVISNVSGVPGLIYATRLAAAVVGVDSGPMHLASALGKPGVAIFGPTDPARNGPYGDTFTVLRSPRAVTTYKRVAGSDALMRDISPEEVFEALKAHLVQRRNSAGCLA
jgi:heptosyltransferase-1